MRGMSSPLLASHQSLWSLQIALRSSSRDAVCSLKNPLLFATGDGCLCDWPLARMRWNARRFPRHACVGGLAFLDLHHQVRAAARDVALRRIGGRTRDQRGVLERVE